MDTAETPSEHTEAPFDAERRPEPEADDIGAADAPAADAPQGDGAHEPAPAATTSDELPPEEAAAPTSGEAEDAAAAPEGSADAPKAESSRKKAKKKAAKKKAKTRKRPPPRAPEKPLSAEAKQQARDAAVARLAKECKGKPQTVAHTVERLEHGASIPFLARFRRGETGGFDEHRLRMLHEAWIEILEEEEHRVRIHDLLAQRGSLPEQAAARLAAAQDMATMDDLAAPFLPVTASRATMARGQGLQALADAIRAASDETPLSELAKPFVPEGADAESTGLDLALGGARDILAEDLSLEAELRSRLRDLYRKEGLVTVAARSEKRADGKEGGPSNPLVGYSVKAAKIPPVKVLAIRRAEKLRQVVATIEPPEERALQIVHATAVPGAHPHAGFLRAAAEDGYRRILKPLLQNEIRLGIKRRADELVMDQYERNLRNLLLGPYGGSRRVLGLRPDVMNGHRWCVIDEKGEAAGSGTLPHEPTAGREACLTELTDVLKTYEVSAVAVGTTGGRADALSLAKGAVADIEQEIEVAEVPDGGTRALEAMGPLEFENHFVVPAECRGALSLARRFQDPLTELVTVDPKALALGPHMHDVHQGRLRRMLDEVVASCVAHVGVDPNTAGADLLQRVPGFTRKATEAFLAWRAQAGPLRSKAGLATIEGVGPEVAEQAVGFLRLAGAEDPRDRSQLHPEQYVALDKMAAQVGVDVPTLFADANARKRVKLDDLADAETPSPVLKYALFQATVGTRDPRQRYTHPIAPPQGMNLETLAEIVEKRGHIELQGRVLRAAPFGVFVDVGLGLEALIPIPHIGDRPGTDPSVVAPVGAVVTARVLEVDRAKKRLTLSMRHDHAPVGRGPAGRGGRGPGGRPPPRGPREGDRRPVGAGAGGRTGDRPGRGPGRPAQGGAPGGAPGARVGQGARSGGRSEGGRGPGDRSAGGDRGPGGRSQGDRPQGGRPQGGRPQSGRRDDRGGGSGGGGARFGGGGGPGFRGQGGRRDDRFSDRGPRTIRLAPDDPSRDEPKVDESKMSPDELLRYKLEQMRKKLERPGAD